MGRGSLIICMIAAAAASPARSVVRPDDRPPCISTALNVDNPDTPGVLGHLPTIASSAYQVMRTGGGDTSASANFGRIEYERRVVLSNSAVREAAMRFYRRVREIDDRDHTESDNFVPIEEASTQDLFQVALQESGGDPLMALSVMGIYGHDNMDRNLYDFTGEGPETSRHCSLQLLDHISPHMSSNLYRNGSIGNVRYSDSLVRQGQAIAGDCARLARSSRTEGLSRSFSSSFHEACNDSNESYQADYYHVINAAHLACREVRLNGGLVSSALRATVGRIGDRAYLDQLRYYKVMSFAEILGESLTLEYGRRNPLQGRELNFFLHVRGVIKKLEKEADVRALPGSRSLFNQQIAYPYPDKKAGPLDPRDAERLRAIETRYRFEIELRLRQHEMGMRFGRAVCRPGNTIAVSDRKASRALSGVPTFTIRSPVGGPAPRPAAGGAKGP